MTTTVSQNKIAPKWMRLTLKIAGVYNILWGAYILFMPEHFFQVSNLPLPNYPEIWQSVGMIVGVYGIGYYISGFDPYTHWPVILVGFLGKVFGPIGAIYYACLGKFPWSFILINVTNDLIWPVPFGLILYHALRKEDLKKYLTLKI